MTETQIKQIFEAYKSAVFAKDVEAFTTLYDKSVRVFDMWGIWSYDGIEAWHGMVTEWFTSLGDEKVEVDFADIKLNISGEMAITSAYITYKGLTADGKELRAMQNRITWALKRENNTWKIVHEHSSAPLDFETGKVILQKK